MTIDEFIEQKHREAREERNRTLREELRGRTAEDFFRLLAGMRGLFDEPLSAAAEVRVEYREHAEEVYA